MKKSSLRITPFSPQVGALVEGVDLRNTLSQQDLSAMRTALHEHGVIFLRGQKLSPEQHIEFARRFAPININRFFRAVDGYAQVAEVRKEPDQKSNIGGGWHTDHSYDLVPAMGSILRAIELPATGGDTLFASMSAAFDALSDGLKQTLRTMNAVHSSRHVFGESGRAVVKQDNAGRIGNADRVTPDVVHPVVIKHPESGRETLYVNPGFTTHFENWTAEESAPLLKYLYDHSSRPEFTCRFNWSDGAIAFWDNRATWHYALNDYHGARRLMHRITVEGSAIPGSRLAHN